MIEALLLSLIWIAVVVGVVFLVLWVLGQIGLPIPARVIQIVWVIVVLVILLILWRAFGGYIPTP